MDNKKFNGFASEAQYEAVLEIIKNEIDSMCDTLMVTYYEDHKVVKVCVDDKSYSMDKFDGVFGIGVNSNSPYVTLNYLGIYHRLNKVAAKMFETIEDYEVQAEYDAYNSQFNFGI